MSDPKRIQRKRTKGWRMPDGAVYVGRPTKWGNPFSIKRASLGDWRVWRDEVDEWWCDDEGMAREFAVVAFDEALRDGDLPRISVGDVQRELAGEDLACWCPLDQPCHADVLLEIANGGVA